MAYRKITLMIEMPTENDKQKIQDWCSLNDIQFCYRYERDRGRLYYFWIYGCTDTFNLLNEHMDNRLVETDFAELGNLLDCSDEDLEKFTNIVFDNRRIMNESSKVHGELCRFIKDINNLAVLEHIDKYVFIEDCKRIIDDKISRAKGEPDSFDKWIKNHCGNNKFDVLDFNVMYSDNNGRWIRIDELNDMIERGIVTVDRYGLGKYHDETRFVE